MDYDEINDKPPTKKVPTESETALERNTLGNNYFIITETQEEDGGKDGVSFEFIETFKFTIIEKLL